MGGAPLYLTPSTANAGVKPLPAEQSRYPHRRRRLGLDDRVTHH